MYTALKYKTLQKACDMLTCNRPSSNEENRSWLEDKLSSAFFFGDKDSGGDVTAKGPAQVIATTRLGGWWNLLNVYPPAD